MTSEDLLKKAKEHIMNGDNDCYLTFRFGNTVDTATEIEMETHCSKMQMLLALVALASKIERSDVAWVRDSFKANTPTVTEDEMLESALNELKKELGDDDKEGNKQDSKSGN